MFWVTRKLHSIFEAIKVIPPLIQHLAISLFLFVLWRWLGADIFFSIYISNVIAATSLVWVLGAILSACKLLLSLPASRIYDKTSPKTLLIASKMIYIIGGFCYFAAGFFSSPWLLVLGIALNGIASPIYFTTVYNLIRHETNREQSTHAFGLINTAIHAGYFLWALCIAFFIDHIQLYYVFLLMIIFTIISMVVNVHLVTKHEKPIRTIINQTFFHDHIYQRVWRDLKSYNITLYLTLLLQLLYGILDYISFLFIPLLGLNNHLSLSQIAIIFAIMRIPYILSFIFSELFDRGNKFVVVCGSYIAISICLIGLSQVEHFGIIMTLSLLVATGLSLVRPIILGFISQLVQANHRSEITGVQEAVSRIGEIIWASGFALIAHFGSLQYWFFWVGLLVWLIAVGTLLQQRLFVLPKMKFLNVVKNTILGIIEDFEEYRK